MAVSSGKTLGVRRRRFHAGVNGPRLAKIFPASEERYREESSWSCSGSLLSLAGA